MSPIAAVARTRRQGPRGGFLGMRWTDVEIVGQHDDGQLVLREVGKFWPGVWLADRDQVRIAGPEFEVGR